MNFERRLQEKKEWAEKVTESFLPEEKGEAGYLIQAMNYSMRAGGKRLRPIMMALAFDVYAGGDESGEDLYAFMAAMEMIHTHSLVHDDLPAMDNDEYRRGKKTTHVVFGEGMAVLAGDALLNLAYETAAKAVSESRHPDRAARALYILASKTGINGMIGGQSVDVLLEGEPIARDTLEYIYTNKTAALIEASLMIGAVLGGADSAQQELMEQIGRKIGIAFQIQDDILDVAGDEALLGKPVGSDSRNEKSTWVTYYSLSECENQVLSLTGEALLLLAGIPGDHQFLEELLTWLVHRNK